MGSSIKSMKLHIGIFGRRNVGKSSFLNKITSQDVSIVSDIAGTTTDIVEKAMELLPIGPVVFIDTAGRLQNKNGLMDELKKVVRVIKKVIPDAPHLTLLTLDATTGQNAVSQVDIFKEIVDVNGLVVTKLDGSSKGGILVAISQENPTPVYFVGVGEKIDDLDVFKAEDYAQNLLGLS